MNIRNFRIQVRRLDEQGKETDLRSTKAGERLAMMWQLAQDAWTFKGKPVAESRLPRHLVKLLLIRNKKAVGRQQDLADIARLEGEDE